MRLLLDAGATVDLLMAKVDVTPLGFAAEAGHAECAGALIRARASVNHADNRSFVLGRACRHSGSLEVVRLLLSAAAAALP